MAAHFPNSHSHTPMFLLVKGTGDPDSALASALCATAGLDTVEVDLGIGESAVLNNWVNRLNLAIFWAERPVVLVAHGLGCLVTAWWAEFERPMYGHPVAGAFLIDPPDIDRPGRDPRLSRLCACPRKALPFSSVLVSTIDQPYTERNSLRTLASDWGATIVEGDEAKLSELDHQAEAWPAGLYFLKRWRKPRTSDVAARRSFKPLPALEQGS